MARARRGHYTVSVKAAIRRWVTAMFVALSAFPGAHGSDAPPVVILLVSYHRADWSNSVIAGVESVLGPGDEISVRPRDGGVLTYALRTEYMDTKWLEDDEYFGSLENIYRRKYADRQVVAVLAVDDHAYRFALTRDAFGRAPVFFCGVNDVRPELHGDRAAGVTESADWEPTLSLALRMFPDTRRIVLLEDDTATGMSNTAEFLANVAESAPSVEIVRSLGLSKTQTAALLASPDPHTVAIFNALWRDGSGNAISVQEQATLLRESRIPVFGRAQWMMGHGLLGGLCVIGEEQGAGAAELLLSYLRTAVLPSSVRESPNRFMFDDQVLRRFRVSSFPLPEGSIVLNRPEPFLKRYGRVLVPSVLVSSALGAVLVAMVLTQRRLRTAELTLRDSLAEKETLLREIHHRVKNNLQVMKSLFSLQRHESGQSVDQIFEAATSRLHAMALVHERLYRDGRFGSIDLREYAEDIVDEIARIYGAGLGDTDIHGPSLFIDIDHAVPVGLFLNEALTNAFKYGQTDKEGPARVSLSIVSSGPSVEIGVKDHGPGFELGGPAREGLGLTLMNAMADQLGGSLRYGRDDGFSVCLSFPLSRTTA